MSIVEPVTASNKEDMSTTATDNGPSCLPSNTVTSAPVVEPPEHEGELNSISKYLVQCSCERRCLVLLQNEQLVPEHLLVRSTFEQEEKKR